MVEDDAIHACDGHDVVLGPRVFRQCFAVRNLVVVEVLNETVRRHQLHELKTAFHGVERNGLTTRGDQLCKIALRRIDHVLDRAADGANALSHLLVERVAPGAAPGRDLDAARTLRRRRHDCRTGESRNTREKRAPRYFVFSHVHVLRLERLLRTMPRGTVASR